MFFSYMNEGVLKRIAIMRIGNNAKKSGLIRLMGGFP